jgi:NADPH-dependent 2,4-dienoyl-CoA reductase/sulfur reductase-like enzyme
VGEALRTCPSSDGTTLSESEVIARSNRLVQSVRSGWTTDPLSAACRTKLSRTRVAIVGGGFAWVMAAWRLCQRAKEIEVVLFEARTDVGGRVWSEVSFTEGRVIEFGAELVAANHPTWLGLGRTSASAS